MHWTAPATSDRRFKDLLGRVFEYFLTKFASAEAKNGGQFYTPSCVVRILVEMLATYKGCIYGPARGSGAMFVELESRIEGETSSHRQPTGWAQRPNDTDFHNGNRARISFQNSTYLN